MKLAIAAAPLFAAFVLMAARPVEAGDDPAGNDERASCKGTVLDENKKPVVGAPVFLRNDWACPTSIWDMPDTDVVAKTVTNESGKFEFTDIDVEPVKRHGTLMLSVVVRANGFALAWASVGPRHSFWDDDEEEEDGGGRDRKAKRNEKPLTILLKPPSQLRGRFVLENGSPAANARIRVVEIGTIGSTAVDALQQLGSFFSAVMPSFGGLIGNADLSLPGLSDTSQLGLSYSSLSPLATTDKEGRFVIDGLPPNHRVALLVTPAGAARQRVFAATTDKPQPGIMYGFPDAAGKYPSVPVYTGDFSAKLRRGKTIRGSVVFADTRQPLRHGVVRLVHMYETSTIGTSIENAFTVKTDDFGRFQIPGIGGDAYSLTVPAPEKSGYLKACVDFERLDREVTEENVQLVRGTPLAGVVVDEVTRKGVGGVKVQYTRHLDYGAPEWVSVDQPPSPVQRTIKCSPTQSDSAGRFTLLVPPGRGSATVSGPVAGYLLPPRSKDWGDDFSKSVEITPGKLAPTLRFEIGRGLTLRGKVRTTDGRAVAGAQIFEYGDHPWGSDIPIGRTQSDASGEYLLAGLVDEPRGLLNPHGFILVCEETRRLKGLIQIPPRKPGQKRSEVQLDLVVQPTATVKARLVVDGRPATGVHAVLSEKLKGEGEKKHVFDSRVETRFNERVHDDGWYTHARYPLASECTLDREGRFTAPFLLPNWNYDLELAGEGYDKRQIAGLRTAPGEIRDLGTIDMDRTRKLELTVVDPAGKPVPDVLISYRLARKPGAAIVRAGGPRADTTDNAEFYTYTGTDRLGKLVLDHAPDRALMVRPYAMLRSEEARQRAAEAADHTVIHFFQRPDHHPIGDDRAIAVKEEATLVAAGDAAAKIILKSTSTNTARRESRQPRPRAAR